MDFFIGWTVAFIGVDMADWISAFAKRCMAGRREACAAIRFIRGCFSIPKGSGAILS